ncbi:hypothetical protein PENSPDRAFT_735536 [Peniophora sp. CONT]|nr:hypothetical protein PENSPDRAFT_735536 [Peniophora sp. CONT]
MSAITFPNGFPSHHSSSSMHEDATYDMLGSASGFQMNPLSAHPPRTPHTSISATSPPSITYNSSDIYTSTEENEEKPVDIEEEVAEAHRELREGGGKPGVRRVRREDVWREILKSSTGRDKALKIIQYTLKMYLLFHSTIAVTSRLAKRSAVQQDISRRATSTVAGLSLARKCLILFNWLPPLTEILAENAASVDPSASAALGVAPPPPKPLLHTFLHAPPPVLLELLNSVADDTSTWSKLGLLTGKTGQRAARVADWCWFASTLIGLVENGVERSMIVGSQRAVETRMFTESMSGATAKSAPRNSMVDEGELEKLQRQDYWLQVTRMKLFMDLIFVSYDVFRVKKAKGPIQTFAGLASALLSSAKLYDKHRNQLLKASHF